MILAEVDYCREDVNLIQNENKIIIKQYHYYLWKQKQHDRHSLRMTIAIRISSRQPRPDDDAVYGHSGRKDNGIILCISMQNDLGNFIAVELSSSPRRSLAYANNARSWGAQWQRMTTVTHFAVHVAMGESHLIVVLIKNYNSWQ